jgi:hypothetical protein
MKISLLWIVWDVVEYEKLFDRLGALYDCIEVLFVCLVGTRGLKLLFLV